MIKKLVFITAIIFSGILTAQQRQAPAYPLVTHDPNFSIWSFGDKINEQSTVHWTGTDQSLVGLIKVDGKVYRFLGNEPKNYVDVLSAADAGEYTVMATEDEPKSGWQKADFDDSNWKSTKAPFGDEHDYVTKWESEDLWVRRKFDLKNSNFDDVFLKLHHDDNIVVYLNGEKILEKTGWNDQYDYFPISEEVKSKLKKKDNILAIHIKNTAGGRFLDAGIVEVKSLKLR